MLWEVHMSCTSGEKLTQMSYHRSIIVHVFPSRTVALILWWYNFVLTAVIETMQCGVSF